MCSPVHEAFCGSYSSIVELREAATHFERAAALQPAPAAKAELVDQAAWCRSQADARRHVVWSDFLWSVVGVIVAVIVGVSRRFDEPYVE